MEQDLSYDQDLRKKYPSTSPEEADAHAWIFPDENTFELYYFKFPQLKDDEVRAKVLYTGLCLSDSTTARGKWGKVPRPVCAGHEVIGRISHIGNNVKDRKVGDLIGVGPIRDSCQSCEFCQTKRDNVCINLNAQQKDTYFYHFGGYATSIQIKGLHTHPIPEGIDITTAPPLLCAGVTVYRPLARHTQKGQKVGILGIGGLGHLGVQFAAALGLEVTAFTTSAEKIQSIKALGAHHVIVVDEKFEAFAPLQNSLDAILNTLPVSDSESMNQYLGLIKPCGKLLQVGAPAFSSDMAYSFFPLIIKQIEIIGSHVGSISDTQEMFEVAAKNNVKVIAEIFKFEEFPAALDKLENGRPIFRCVVNVEDYAKKHKL